MSEDRVTGYLQMIDMSYEEAVAHLKDKYGEVLDDYFKESSYNRFLEGKIKAPGKGKFSRAKEGLYTHHVAENRALKLADAGVIMNFRYPYELQRRNNLVYADAVEHLILHAIIAKETDGRYGLPGYSAYLQPQIVEWYYSGNVPGVAWVKACYDRAFLTMDEFLEVNSRIETSLLSKL
ncbi:hypothetical protein [Lacticaseibacillus sharpeae]|uniref:Uncharacterized protein n=1 Tax=Lacticaseibacillus sharpeae JCM 1186 = DSM 20505 TaxID=1291052 RepID=A0A0R1ZJZ7_9LACO|nr:hypothetical protein [Lacticaseibacillus sharpeae]KRM55264.1 hypothetical protein FC18_GL001425 [Lacticaseibacillus sharpeae JCM 1186 = DSM 20505]